MILLDSIATLIESAGLAGGATGWLLKKGFLPDDADQTVAIFETGGPAPKVLSDGSFFNSTFQVRVRSVAFDYEGARAKIIDIMSLLHDIDSPDFTYIYMLQSGPLPLGNDGNNRPNFTVNFTTAWDPLAEAKSDYVTMSELLTASLEASHIDSISTSDTVLFSAGFGGNNLSDGYGSTNFGR